MKKCLIVIAVNVPDSTHFFDIEDELCNFTGELQSKLTDYGVMLEGNNWTESCRDELKLVIDKKAGE